MNIQKNIIAYLVAITSTLSILLVDAIQPAQAKGELLVAPTRVVFDSRRRSARVNLVNVGDEVAIYRITFIQKRMTEAGKFVDIKEALPGENFLGKMVRFSPRQVTLQPGQSQVIRLILRKPENLEDGEYRSRLLFRAVPDDGRSSIEPNIQKEGQLSIKLTPIIGISIPVIVRHGKTIASIAIEDIKYLAGKKPLISFVVKRTGNRSVYGDFTVNFIDSQGEKYVISKANGIAVYAPNKLRRVKLALQAPPELTLQNGKMEITFHEKDIKGGGLLAEGVIVIP